MLRTQINRPLGVSTPLGEDVLLLKSMMTKEELGKPFEYTLSLLSESTDIDFSKLVGETMTVRLALPNDEIRYYNGFVSRFVQVGFHGEMTAFVATLVPWFWLLSRNADCRIFQKKSVPDIIKEIFRDRGFSAFEESLSGQYDAKEYCVQYRETDFAFISRLFEQEGIYYYFKHEKDKHTLIFTDDLTHHKPISGYDSIPYFPPDETAIRERDAISAWTMSQQIQPGTFSHNDFYFETPRSDLLTKTINTPDHAQSAYEIFDYPGGYRKNDEGQNYANVRIQALQQRFEVFQGECNARGLSVGHLFSLTGLPREDQNQEYLVVSSSSVLTSDAFDTDNSTAPPMYACTFSAIESKRHFRSTQDTPKPIVQGPQTAIVVGPTSEEIWTDPYGRVRVQFHWDRYGKSDENSSCWIRVSQLWAGGQWGAIYTPRIGQEVIVEFLEGDPDRPIITGRVYNGAKMPPYELPAEKTKSTIKSNTTQGGGGSNEFRFEDKAGDEEIYIHAQKDQNNVVENDETTKVGHDRTEDVGHDETITIGSDRSVTIGKNKSETITLNKAETIGVAKELTIGGAYQVTVGAAMNETVGGAKMEEVGAYRAEVVAAHKKTSVGKDFTVTVDKKYALEGKEEISIQSGQSSVTMNKDGKIEISGTDVTFKTAAGKIHIDAGGIITIKGSMVKINCS